MFACIVLRPCYASVYPACNRNTFALQMGFIIYVSVDCHLDFPVKVPELRSKQAKKGNYLLIHYLYLQPIDLDLIGKCLVSKQ